MEALYAIINLISQKMLEAFLIVANSTERLYFLYIMTALIFAHYVFKYKKKGKGIFNFLAFTFPKKIYLHRSAYIDYVFYLLTPLMFALIIGPLLITALPVSMLTSEFLHSVFGKGNFLHQTFYLNTIYSLLFFLCYDFGKFYSHYLQHRIWFLWELHKIHHSAQVLVPFTAYRFHPLDNVLVNSFVGIFTGLLHGFFVFAMVEPFTLYHFLSLQIPVFLFYLFAYNLRHSHIWVAYPKWLSKILISPSQHQIHHSVEKKHWDKNFGFVLAIWDYFFKTLYITQEREEIQYGLTQHEDQEYQTILSAFLLPLYKIGYRIYRFAINFKKSN